MMYGHFHSQQAHALGDINSHGSTTWTSSKKAKYHHLAPQYQSVESYRHGAPASTSLILDNHAHASSIMEHANTSSTSSTGSNENSSNEDNTHNGHEIEERDLDVENEEDAAFLVYSLNQPLPPRNLNKAATHSSSSISSSIHHNCNSSSSIASSSCSVGGNSLLLSTRPASAASVLSASAMMSAVTGVISSTTSLTHTTTSTTSLLVVPSSVAEFQSIASVSSKDGPGIVSGISSIQEINAVLAAADLYLGQVVDHPPAWQVMRPVAVGSLTTAAMDYQTSIYGYINLPRVEIYIKFLSQKFSYQSFLQWYLYPLKGGYPPVVYFLPVAGQNLPMDLFHPKHHKVQG